MLELSFGALGSVLRDSLMTFWILFNFITLVVFIAIFFYIQYWMIRAYIMLYRGLVDVLPKIVNAVSIFENTVTQFRDVWGRGLFSNKEKSKKEKQENVSYD